MHARTCVCDTLNDAPSLSRLDFEYHFTQFESNDKNSKSEDLWSRTSGFPCPSLVLFLFESTAWQPCTATPHLFSSDPLNSVKVGNV